VNDAMVMAVSKAVRLLCHHSTESTLATEHVVIAWSTLILTQSQHNTLPTV